jgi:hypothetical protein
VFLLFQHKCTISQPNTQSKTEIDGMIPVTQAKLVTMANLNISRVNPGNYGNGVV